MAPEDVAIDSAPLGIWREGPLSRGRGAEGPAGEGPWISRSWPCLWHGTLPGTLAQPWNQVAQIPKLQLWVRLGGP